MVFGFICAISTGFSNAHLVQLPKVEGLPAPHPLAISADGRNVVGQFAPGNPFLWRGGSIIRFRPSSDQNVLDQYAVAASFDGKTIVGRAGGAYVWTRGKGMKLIGDESSSAHGVSEKGTEVACQVDGKDGIRGFLWTPTGKINFDSFSPMCISGDGKVVAGIRVDHGSVKAYEFKNQVAQELPIPDEFTDSSAFATNKDGSIIVGSVTNDKRSSAGLWKNSKFLKLMDLGQTTAVATCVARDGSLIGGYLGTEAALWTSDGKVNYLEIILRTSGANTNGWKFESIDGIAKVGKTVYVTGWAHLKGNEAGYWASFRVK